MARAIFTVGHSTLTADAFFELLSSAGVRTLADVRAFPASRRHPHFARAALAEASTARGLTYRWMPALGGRRRAVSSASPHGAWKVEGFRNYADYMDTEEFAVALTELEREAVAAPTAFTCAEALWWRCHRRLIADRLLVSGWYVRHIGAAEEPTDHRLPSLARVVD